jgi:hypothetical protein
MIRNTKLEMILLFAIAALVLPGCTDGSIISTEVAPGELAVTDANAPLKLRRADGAVTVPFKASFFTEGADPKHDCSGPHPAPVLQVGDGQATHLGKFSTRITFCADPTDVPGGLEEGESIPYVDGVGTFTAANGDMLRFTIAGEILPSDHPDFDFEFADPFEFTGGTGRFTGASGGGVTESFVDFQADRTEHYWSGELILHPGI